MNRIVPAPTGGSPAIPQTMEPTASPFPSAPKFIVLAQMQELRRARPDRLLTADVVSNGDAWGKRLLVSAIRRFMSDKLGKPPSPKNPL